VGSEGTLGVFTEITVDVIELPAAVLAAIAFVGSERVAMALAADLRTERGGRGVDVRAVEVVDGRSLDLVRAHGETARLKIGVPPAARAAVFVEAELPVACTGEQALEALGRYLEGEAAERGGGMLFALFERLQAHDALDDVLLAMPDDPARREAFAELREAVPKRVNEILAGRRRDDPGIRKVGGDLIVPFERLPEMWEVYEREFEARGLEFAIWGHLSDGNLHPNVLARSAAEVEAGEQALLVFADLAIRLGGSPLSEHGVGRSVLKQEMLRRLVGEAGLEGMRAVKSALDPEWRMAPGVLLGVKS